MVKQETGIELAARFSLITNRLRFCGPKEAYQDFFFLLKKQKYDETKLIEQFKKFEGLYVYLGYIGSKFNKNPLSYEVVEAYWLGNELLDSYSKEDLIQILTKLTERGLPQDYADLLITKLPPGMNPHHSFNVLFVGVGKTTGSVPTNLLTMNKCVVSTGKVLKIQKGTLMASVQPLVVQRGKLQYSKSEFQHVEYDKELFSDIKIGDKVAIHWDFACKILTEKEEHNLKKYTQQNIDTLNSALFFSNAPKKP